MAAPPKAHVEHQLPGRCRLRMVEPWGDDYFAQLKSSLQSCEGVLEVSVRPLTSSVLVLHECSVEELVRFAAEHELFELGESDAETPRSPLQAISDELDQLDRRLREGTEGKWGLGSLAFYGLMAAGGLQAAKGNLFPAASTLLYQAVRVMKEVVELEAARRKTRH